MSVVFNIKEFDDSKCKEINDLLTFIPENPSDKYNIKKYTPADPTPVRMFQTGNGKLYLPYRFSCSFFNKIYNLNPTNYPSIQEKRGNFSGKLLSRQIDPYNEALEYLKKYRTVTIALYPGFGKTFLGVMLSWLINKKTCVLVHRESIGKQWVKTFLKNMNLEEKDVWFVGDKKDKLDAKILICMNGRTDKIPEKMRSEIGLLIIDEAHCFCSVGKVKPLLAFSPTYIIAETATPVKENGMHKIIQSICGSHYIKKVSTKPHKFYIIQTNLEFKTDSKNPFTELVNLQTENEVRNKLIIDLLRKNKHKKTIIATSRVGHCEVLKEMIADAGMDSSELYGNKKNYVTKDILIGTGSKMGVGFDEENFCDDYDGRPSDLLMICYTFATWSPFEQVRGRGMRADKPTVVMFNDRHGITRKHFTQIRKWVAETKGELIELKLDKIKDNIPKFD